ncbi:MAG: ABC transporter permease, partial [Chloroflexi bacterium]|nr:ABC transporter permease [Chloroflexota bacterium]
MDLMTAPRVLAKRSVVPVLFVTVWELAPRYGLVSSFAIPPFSDAIKVLFELMAGGVLLEHIAVSIFRAMSGLAIATVLGVTLGVLLGVSRTAHDMVSLLVELLRPISPIA